MQIKELGRVSKKFLSKEQFDERIKKLRKEHEKPVKGMFEFLDAQGGWLDFAYRIFPEDPLYTIRLNHGEITELPMGIVKHLNNTKKKVRKMPSVLNPGERGVGVVCEYNSRIRFTPVDVL
ncbi:MAG TPA: hypothetical protein VHZ50_16395 [Puia sp.]|jgi:hypothetical protein|nr:hypothetical protein [Puia sp.]